MIRKPIDQLIKEASNTRELKRVLGSLNLTTLGIGAIIGAGIFVLTGQAAAQRAFFNILLCVSVVHSEIYY